jgi:glyoxylase-like metal-dependent hydrolase (beta-lactamase superfamily II)
MTARLAGLTRLRCASRTTGGDDDLRTSPDRWLPVVPDRLRRDLRGRADRPEISQIDHYVALAAREGLRVRYVIDTHTHADHFSATREIARQLNVPVIMHRSSPAPFVDMRLGDGELIVLGKMRLQAIHTPGHTRDSMCLMVEDRVFTGDTLLIGATGRTDLPSGDPEALYDSAVRAPAEARPGAQGLSGARLQGAQPFDDRRRDRDQPAPAEARARRVRRDDAQSST